MKTGTPARLSRKSIDFSKTEEQPGEYPIRPFSFRTSRIERPQISCWITGTNEQAHDIIRQNVARSPMFNGQIQSRGPRYCPSIEDKVFRFKDKTSHHIFLEPEGFESDMVYPNGISTSLPMDVQEAFVRAIPGLENAQFHRYGYAVEYDHVDPTELDESLAAKSFKGLYFAGQINGTSGYEEAGAQGLVAGINAALFVREEAPLFFRRDQSYIGVMIDDLTSMGVVEPYRMFTSRAEYRLQLREDNADVRLTPIARRLGLVSDEAWRGFEVRQELCAREKSRLESTVVVPSAASGEWLRGIGSAVLYDAVTLSELLRRPEMDYEKIVGQFPSDSMLSEREYRRLETELKFEGYLKRQEEDIARVMRMEGVVIPEDFPYEELRNLSVEVRERLVRVRPRTLGKASRISGVTPAAVSLIAIQLKKMGLRERRSSEQVVDG